MKQLTLLLLSPFLICTSMAQNGGQKQENNFAKISFIGYSNGSYVVDVNNKQACGIDFQIEWLNKDTTIYIQSSSTQRILLPGTAQGMKKITAKPLYRCGTSGGDLGWVEAITPESLPVKFTYFNIEQVGKTEVKVTFEIAEAHNLKLFDIKVRANDGEFRTVTILFPDEIEPNRRYSVKVSLSTSSKK